jgi:hypothetical protein
MTRATGLNMRREFGWEYFPGASRVVGVGGEKTIDIYVVGGVFFFFTLLSSQAGS